MTKTIFAFVAAALLGALTNRVAYDALGSGPAPSGAPAGGPSNRLDFYKIVRAQYVNLSGNLGTFNTTCFMTNTHSQPITLKEVYVLGPGGSTSILATYTGLVGVTVPPGGQVQLPIDIGTIVGITPETSVTGNGVKSVVVGWSGPMDALELSAVIERNDSGSLNGRAFVSLLGVPLLP